MSISQQPAPITLFDILTAVFRYKGRFLVSSLLALVAAGTLILLLPKKYESEAKLFVRLGRSSTGVDPATIGPTISIQDSRETEINSIIDLLQSRGLAEIVVGQIGADRICEKTTWLERQMDWAMGLTESFFPDDGSDVTPTSSGIVIDKSEEAAIGEFLGNLKIVSPKKSTTLSVVYRAATPETARDVVDAIVQVFQELHIRSNVSSGSVEFFTEQFGNEKSLLFQAETEFQTLKNDAGILSLVGARDSLQAEQSGIRLQLIQANADYAAAAGRMEELKKALATMPEVLESEKTAGIEAAASDTMRDRLFELEIREKELSAKFLDNHPDLLKVRQQLADARKIQESQPSQREHTVTAVNPVVIEIRKELFVAEANVASLKTRLETLEKMDSGLLARLEQLNTLEIRAESLQRDINISRDNHQIYARKLEEARINSALDREALTNVSVVSAPSLRYKHTSPKRSVLAIAALAISFLTGFFVALASDWLARAREFTRQRESAERLAQIRPAGMDLAQATGISGGREDTVREEPMAPSRPR